MRIIKSLALVAAVLLGFTGKTRADYEFVGSWQVDQGPAWPTAPLIMSGQDVAALLFGGLPTDYAISTVDDNPANIDHLTWHSGYGSGDPNFAPILPDGSGVFPAGSKFGESVRPTENGDTNYTQFGDYSAYVTDWAVGPQFTNYAFRFRPVPEPSSFALAGLGACVFALVRRRTRSR